MEGPFNCSLRVDELDMQITANIIDEGRAMGKIPHDLMPCQGIIFINSGKGRARDMVMQNVSVNRYPDLAGIFPGRLSICLGPTNRFGLQQCHEHALLKHPAGRWRQ